MRQRSDTWKRLAARGLFRMESIAIIDGVEYDAISAPIINRALLADNLSVGNCISSTLKLSVLTDDVLGKAAKVVIKARITDDVEYSEWLEFGTFYIDTRSIDSGLVTIQCYDAMLKASQQYGDETNPEDRIGWPKSMKACVNEIAARIGVELDPRTVIKTTDPYQVPYPNKMSMMEVLGYIGACHGGNWVITPENKLRLVPLLAPPAETFNVIDHDYNPIYTGDGHKLVWQHTDTGETVEHRGGGGLINVPVVVGNIATSKTFTITRVILARDEDLGYAVGDDSGYTLIIESNPYACQAICDDLFAELDGMEYAPYTITSACYDPATELGDWFLVGDKVRSVLYSETATLNVDFRVNASAPGKDEVGSEYPYLTSIQRLQKENEQLKKYTETEKDEIYSKIDQRYTDILLYVGGTYATKEAVSASIAMTAESITAEVKRAKGAEELLSSSITQTANSIAAEVTRAKGAEESLSSTLKVTADAITTEVTRAKGKEAELASQISQTASQISLKVSKGDVSSQISVETGQVSIGSNRFTVDSDNFKLSGNGAVEARGKLITEMADNDTTYRAEISGGAMSLYLSDDLLLQIKGALDSSYRKSMFRFYGEGLSFVAGAYTSCYTIANGTHNYSERNLFYDGVRCLSGDIVAHGNIIFDDRTIWGDPTDSGSVEMRKTVYSQTSTYGLVVDGAFLSTTGDLLCDGQKYRAITTDNYGRVGLSAMESAVALFSDIGSGTIDDTGVAYIYIDPVFAETIDNAHEYQVFVSAADCAALCKVEKHIGYFVVYGTEGTTFDWIIFARQKDYVTHRLEALPVDKQENIKVNNSIFYGDDTAAAQTESYMDEFIDTYDEQAEAYLRQYEQEVTNYGN